MQINLSKTAAKNLIDLINAENNTALTSAEITLGQPAEFVDGEGTNDRNTQVEVSAVPGSGYTDSVMVRYYRLDLDVLKGARVLTYTKSEASTLESFIDSIATQCEIIEDQVEIVDGEGDVLTELPVLSEGEPAQFTLRAKADSYTYFGSTEVTLEPIPVTEEHIEEEIENQDLDGFEYPEEEGGED